MILKCVCLQWLSIFFFFLNKVFPPHRLNTLHHKVFLAVALLSHLSFNLEG